MQEFLDPDKAKLDSLDQFTKKEATKNESLVIIREEEDHPRSYGTVPNERPIKEYLKYGYIVLDKPQGPTSHEVVAWVRRIMGTERAGHSGTLDPMVSGVLPIGLGHATKALSAMLLGPKEYVAVARIHDSVPSEVLDRAFSNFIGPIYQKPPQRSSVKRVTRTREIYKIDILQQKGNLILLKVLCEAGTYIRKLIYDYGEVLKVGATMAELRRSRVCQFDEGDLVRLHDLYEAKAVFDESGKEEKLKQVIKPVEESVGFLKQIRIRDSAVDSICHGAQLAVPGVVALSSGLSKGEIIRLTTGKGELVALAESQMDEASIKSAPHGLVALTRRVVMESGTYPKMWKSKKEETGTQEVGEEMLKKSLLEKLETEDDEPSS
ncbi:MAG: RNA-guided pseudouridylation complex pseudouridine synthase subunit Cbf5 [Nitrososphaerales archaeon]